MLKKQGYFTYNENGKTLKITGSSGDANSSLAIFNSEKTISFSLPPFINYNSNYAFGILGYYTFNSNLSGTKANGNIIYTNGTSSFTTVYSNGKELNYSKGTGANDYGEISSGNNIDSDFANLATANNICLKIKGNTLEVYKDYKKAFSKTTGNFFGFLSIGTFILNDFVVDDLIEISNYTYVQTATGVTVKYKYKNYVPDTSIKHYMQINNAGFEEIQPTFTKINELEYECSYYIDGMVRGTYGIEIKVENEYKSTTAPKMYVKLTQEVYLLDVDKSKDIILYEEIETDFRHRGLGTLKNITDAKITEINNGNFTFEFIYFINDSIAEYIKTGAIVKVRVGDNRNNQLFRIRNTLINNNKIKVFASAIALSDVLGNYIYDINIEEEKTGIDALNFLLSNTLFLHNFKATGDIFELKIPELEMKNLSNLLLDDEKSIISNYNCKVEFDNFNINLLSTRNGNEIEAREGKNILEIEDDIDDFDICTVLIPKSSDGYMLDEIYVESKYINNYVAIRSQEIVFQDIKISDEYPAIDDVKKALREKAEKVFEVEQIDLPKFSLKLGLKELKNLRFSDYISIGTRIKCYHKRLGTTIDGTVVERQYNPITNENESITIGFRKKSLNQALGTEKINKMITGNMAFTSKKYVNNAIENNLNDFKTTISNNYTTKTDFEALEKTAVSNTSVISAINSTSETGKISSDKINVEVSLSDIVGSDGCELSTYNGTFNFICSALQAGSNSKWFISMDGTSATINVPLTVNDVLTLRYNIIPYSSTIDLGKTNSYFNYGYITSVECYDINCKTKADIASLYSGYTRTDGDLDTYGDGMFSGDVWIKGDLDLYNSSSGIFNCRYCGVVGDLAVTGTKNSSQSTENYGYRKINAYETSEYYFGDVGEAYTENGECYIYLDDIFRECINTELPYQVFITKYGKGDIWVEERTPEYFLVKSDNDISFGWEIKGKRIGYETIRLEEDLEIKKTIENEQEKIDSEIVELRGDKNE